LRCATKRDSLEGCDARGNNPSASVLKRWRVGSAGSQDCTYRNRSQNRNL